jgi:cellulose synthase/poly-beta-1,6-N-acetylglucosamine synthase-like glycosyltransferase
VIVPVKGEDEGLAENLRSLASLDYPDYELVVAAQYAADIPPGALPHGVRVVLAGAGDPSTGGKIVNLAAAVRHARQKSAILAFADSDGQVPPGWLRALAAPLRRDDVGASTGYRWYTPQPPDLASLLRAVWNGAIAASLATSATPFAWGGAMAMRRDRFEQLNILERWKGQVSDDSVLTGAVRDAGLRIVYAPGALVCCTDHIGLLDLLRWTTRQIIITRVYHSRLWLMALAAHVVYCVGMAASVAAGWWGALVLQLAPGMWKAGRRGGWTHALLAPAATWLWMWSLAASAFRSNIVWRGRRYRLR